MRASWAAIGAGAGLWALGEVAWCYYELIENRATPFPSVADVGYLLFPAGAVLGLWLYPSADRLGARSRWLLDGGIIVSALVTLSWVTTLGAVARAGGDSTFALAVSAAYPVGDILILSMAVLAGSRPRAQHGHFVLLSVTMVAMAFADSSFAYLTATGQYSTGGLGDIGWVAAFLLLAVAAASSGSQPSADAVTLEANPGRVAAGERPAAATMLPYLPLLLATLTVAIRRMQGHDLDAVEFISVSIALVLVLARQYMGVSDGLCK